MLTYGTILRHYKKKWIQEEILRTALNREVAVRFENGMGKRPDALFYPQDVFLHAKSRVSSFHISEERWSNPMSLSTGLKKHELDALRTGWDLVIDIDFPIWEATVLIAEKVVEALREHGISAISAKFSGNKGFHIGVPFESFPEEVKGEPLSALFPDGVKRIAEYLIHYLDNPGNHYALSKGILALGEGMRGHLQQVCEDCGTVVLARKERYEYLCSRCGHNFFSEDKEEAHTCERCGYLMDITSVKATGCPKCHGEKVTSRMNLQIDTMLISQRHLYRSVFSLHEKSGLVSVPVDPYAIRKFDRESAHPDALPKEISPFFEAHRFLDTEKAVAGEASRLLVEAFDYRPQVAEEHVEAKPQRRYEALNEKIPVECFPPSILQLLEGLEDGRKRGLFILKNFLRSVGWQFDEIEEAIVAWNAKNKEPIRETYLRSQLDYQKRQKEIVLPPNYDNGMYYADLKVGTPEELHGRFKNPVQYARMRFRQLKGAQKKARPQRERNKKQERQVKDT